MCSVEARTRRLSALTAPLPAPRSYQRRRVADAALRDSPAWSQRQRERCGSSAAERGVPGALARPAAGHRAGAGAISLFPPATLPGAKLGPGRANPRERAPAPPAALPRGCRLPLTFSQPSGLRRPRGAPSPARAPALPLGDGDPSPSACGKEQSWERGARRGARSGCFHPRHLSLILPSPSLFLRFSFKLSV